MKKFWLPTLQQATAALLVSAVLGCCALVRSEINFHVQVNERLAWIEKALGKDNQNKKETHVAINP